MIPRTDILLSRIRQESDTVDENSLSDFVLTNYLNDAQRTIQNLIFQSDKLNNVFTTYTSIDPVAGQIEYDLPSNVYADNSIISVWGMNDTSNKPGQRYDKMEFGEKAPAYGYSVRNKKIIFGTEPQRRILVVYNYRLPILSLRVGKIASILGQAITITTPLAGFSSVTEYVSIVDKVGLQIATGLYIDGFATPVLTVEGDLTNVTSDHYVVMGDSASSHSSLPDECETFLKIFVQRKALAHINSKKVANADIFSKEEREDLIGLFSDKHSDIEYPVVVDYDYLDY